MYHGLTTAEKYPYLNKQNEKCSYNVDTDQDFTIDAYKVYEYMTNEDLMRLACRGVVSVGIRINNCIKNYESGVLYDGDGVCGCSQP